MLISSQQFCLFTNDYKCFIIIYNLYSYTFEVISMLDSKQQIEEMTDSKLAKLLTETKDSDVMDKVFEIFSLTCINLCQPEYKSFDTLIK